ncbi:MAG: Bcr/CflA family drug resistance efflux transporter, partial [Bradyrhizobium sp.]|nr:Bcr/CflA family drug resistance efflux transporter [Bradyrhizobium sp.]
MTQSVPFSVAVALGLITLLAPVSVDMYLPSLPVMAEEMNTTYPAMQLTLMVFLLAMGAGQIVFGPVIDAYG